MGATNFCDIGKGRTIEKAFAAAVDQAQYDHGHAGYTGTIAEKAFDGYVVFDRPPRWTPEKIERLVWKASSHLSNLEWERSPYGRPKPKKFPNETDEQFKARKANARKWATEDRKAYDKLVGLFGYAEAHRMIALCNDKWGPCVAIQKAPGQWYFFGLASC